MSTIYFIVYLWDNLSGDEEACRR